MTKRGFAFNPFENHPRNIGERVQKKLSHKRSLPRLLEAKVEPLLLPLVDLPRNGCHYPYGDVDFRFCGLPTMVSSLSYCAGHHALCYNYGIPRYLTVPSSLAA